jgi:hypothetical protein
MIYKRDILREWVVARNMGKSFFGKAWRLFVAHMFMFKAFIIGMRGLRHEKLGSKVLYKGRVLHVSNWAGSEHPTLSGKGFYKERCARAEIKNIRSIPEFWHRFWFSFSFYTSSHLRSDVDRWSR